jgi:hypothetical protein
VSPLLSIECDRVTELVDALITHPLTSLKFASCPFLDGTGQEMARCMNTPYVVNGNDDDGTSNALQDLCTDFGRAAMPATFDADMTAMVHPIVSVRSPQDEIGDDHDSATNLELDGVGSLIIVFGLFCDHALQIRLERFRTRMVSRDNAQAMVESILHWVHAQSFGVCIVATEVEEQWQFTPLLHSPLWR